ncbi:hypothetical protein J421_5041 (plasmid) [Gemmatirosa kalamazoonensis]|uniref:PGM1 C-terminal domain-containing protein n=1 Tax=Gemmatirosa kalamazoonensis TaxID=861299 RepID=W0RPB4_9BACT|nr:peptide ligase PGM1-related protein [Gemmatirosa kalamazoonensis]AHG92576.1 hypothetical protein J421_5041 [Gemmatirosa kalamazoonensis]
MPDSPTERTNDRPPRAAPMPGSPDERRAFADLQRGLAPMYRRIFPDPLAPRTVVVVPSMSLDAEALTKLVGASHYEERLLCLLMLLRLPHTRLVYVTSQPIAPSIIDYYLHLLPGVPVSHARRRLTLLSCGDDSPAPLTRKILDRPWLVDAIRAAIADPTTAHVSCFNATALERTLAVRLGVPLYACDPALADLGTKSGSREVFRQAGVAMPDGHERLRDVDDLVDALVALKRRRPLLRRVVIKLEEGFSGEGNAVLALDGAPNGSGLARWLRAALPARARCVAPGETWESYRAKLARMGGIVEAFVEHGDAGSACSPSVQCRIDPLGRVQIVSTHDQVLGGPTGQVFLGCAFPADPSCAAGLHESGRRIAEVLRDRGAIGRFAVDFVSTRRGAAWDHRAIEINLRKGGTTHPYLTLQFLTDGAYDPATGLYHTPTGQPCYYVASDNLHDPAYRGLAPEDLFDIVGNERLHFDGATARGVVFHLLGALSDHGKLGAVCIGPTREHAQKLYDDTVDALQRVVGAARTPVRAA